MRTKSYVKITKNYVVLLQVFKMFNRPQKLEQRKNQKLKSSSSYFGSYTSLISPSAAFNRLMGFLPYKLESSKFVYSKSYFVFSTISIIIYLICVILSLYQTNFSPMRFTELSYKLQFILIFLCGPVIFISAYTKNQSMIRAIDSISNVSRILSSETWHKVVKKILIKDILILLPPMCCIPYNLFWVPYIFCYTCWHTFIGAIVLTSLYTNNVYVLNACFKYINDSLVKVKEILVNDEPHLLRRVYHMQKNPILLTKLRTLKKQHLEMSEVVQLLNNTCSMQIEAMLTIMSIFIIFTIYNYLSMHKEIGEVKSLILILGFAIYYIVHVIITVSIVEITRDQMQKTGRDIHRILVHTFDEQVTMELELFSLQVLQKGNAFVMNGLVIDATLLTKMACGITTFLLILVQFLLVESC
ncbi:putative gustatory receptor 28b isoform X2 [Bombus flavifrons]|uniref:putative gustatory receptor 28b isoform X2 n=1 Tax=Bombus flavifrons TaxID=103934 RepID=UPI003704742C